MGQSARKRIGKINRKNRKSQFKQIKLVNKNNELINELRLH